MKFSIEQLVVLARADLRLLSEHPRMTLSERLRTLGHSDTDVAPLARRLSDAAVDAICRAWDAAAVAADGNPVPRAHLRYSVRQMNAVLGRREVAF